MKLSQDTLIYNALDAVVTESVRAELWPELPEYQDIYDFTIRLHEPLMFMMSRGIKINTEALESTKKELNALIAQKRAELDELAGRPLNPNSPKDCQAYFYIELGINPYTNKGKITTDDKAMQRLAKGTASRPGRPEAKLVQEIRGLRKLVGTYLDIDFDEDMRFRCSYNPRGTKFGRISSSKTVFGTGTNMQNLPVSAKQFLEADPGYCLVELDKRQAEWVVVAFITGDANMMQVVLEGKDPHTFTAAKMFDVPENLIIAENKLIGHESDPVEIAKLRERFPQLAELGFITRNMSMRQAGKKANHGLNYDEGYRTFALQNEMLDADSKKVINFYHHIYPGIRIWYKHDVQAKLAKDRTLYNCLGRKYRFRDAWGDKLFKAAYSFNPQSTVGDLVNWAIIHTYEDQSPWMQPIELLAQVHDSILFQYPIDRLGDLSKAVHTMKEYMDPTLEYNGRSFKIETDMKVGFNWKDMGEVPISTNQRELSKDIERVLNELREASI